MRQLAHNAEALVVALLMKMGAVLSKRTPPKKPHNRPAWPGRRLGEELRERISHDVLRYDT